MSSLNGDWYTYIYIYISLHIYVCICIIVLPCSSVWPGVDDVGIALSLASGLLHSISATIQSVFWPRYAFVLLVCFLPFFCFAVV